MERPEVVFFGSGPVAARSLELLLEDFSVVAVVTKPKPAHHRGSFPVLDLAEAKNLPLFTVRDKHELSALIARRLFRTEVAILIDFGIIVTKDVIDHFPRGIINSHFSLLPEWRGADPITFAILSGQQKTGVSLMLLVEAMDEGPIIGCGVQPLDGTETTPLLTDRLINLSHSLLKHDVPRYLAGETQGAPQEKLAELIPDHPSEPSYSRKLTKQDGELDFRKSAEVLEREVRAFTEWPKSHTKLANIDVIITSASTASLQGNEGDIRIQDKRLFVCCAQDALEIHVLKPAGKQAMTAGAFIAGYKNRLVV
jgi:methionyl-tRNA formyltransferase